MKKANIAELKNRLSYYIERVKRGETVLVLDRRMPVARLVPLPPPAAMNDDEQEAWLKGMAAKGILKLGTGRKVPEILNTRPPGKRPVGAVKALLEDRERR